MAIASGTCGTCSWDISDSGVLTIGPGTLEPPALVMVTNTWPWKDYKTQITSAVISSGVVVGDAAPFMGEPGPPTISTMFEGCSSMTSLAIQGTFDTSRVESAVAMFWNCSSLTSLDLSVLDTRKVNNMGMMFMGCPLLTSIKLGPLFDTSSLNEGSGPGLVDNKEFPSAVNVTNGIVVTSSQDFDSLTLDQHNGVWQRRASAETFDVNAVRSDNGEEDEEGEDAKITVTWVTGSSASDRLIRVYMKRAESPSYPSAPQTVKYLSGNSGMTDIFILGIGDPAYDFRVEFYDGENTYISFPSVSSNIRLVTISPGGVLSCHNTNGDFGTIFELLYPVGCYFETSDADFNPNLSWGGSWVLENPGVVHVSSGTGYAVSGAVGDSGRGIKDGGETSHALTPSETAVKDHSHSLSEHTHSLSSHTHTINHGHGNNISFTVTKGVKSADSITGGSHAHKLTYTKDTASGSAKNRVVPGDDTGTVGENPATKTATHTHSVPSHAHDLSKSGSVTDHSGSSGGPSVNTSGGPSTNSTGGLSEADGAAHNNMQPYINVYRWHRTA